MSVRICKSVNNILTNFTRHESDMLARLFTFQCKDGFNPRIMKKVPGKKIVMMLSDGNHVLLPMHLGRQYAAVFATQGISIIQNTSIKQTSWSDSITLRDYQIQPCQQLLDMLLNQRSALMNLYTGFGKTLLSAKLSRYLGVKTLVLIGGKTYESSWISAYRDSTTANVAIVPTKSKWKKDTNDKLANADVIISLAGRSKGIPNYVRSTIGLLVVDEADTFCTEIRLGIIMSFTPTYLLMCTATTKRENGADKALDILCGEVNRVVKKIDKPLTVNFMHTSIVPEFERVEGVKSWTSVMDSLMMNNERNCYIVNLIKWNLSMSQKVMVLFFLKAHLELISELLLVNGVDHGKIYGSRDEYKETMCLLATTSKSGRGFDEKSFSGNWNGVRISRLILCNTIKAESSFLQYIGRAERSDHAEVFVLIDNDPSIAKHKKKMVAILDRRGKVLMRNIDISV